MDLYVNSQASDQVKPRSGFQSAKTVGRIVYQKRWHQIALIELTFEPRIGKISPSEKSYGVHFSVVVDFVSGERKSVIFVDEAGPTVESDFPDAIVLRRSDVYVEPRLSNAKSIWKSHGVSIGFSDRLRILAAVAPHGITIAEAAKMVRTPKLEGYDGVARLICDGDLVVDLDTRIGLDTKIRLGSALRVAHKSSSESPEQKWSQALDF